MYGMLPLTGLSVPIYATVGLVMIVAGAISKWWSNR